MIQTEKNPIPGRNRQTETSYKEAFDNSRWMMEETKTAHITARNNKISVIGGSAMPESDLLSRCVDGKFQLFIDYRLKLVKEISTQDLIVGPFSASVKSICCNRNEQKQISFG
uniref:Putative ovule protein n=1 Tax=Solanum chacoense TaxID=4108 RepID=A0A0V0H5T2_SOLCH